MSTAAGVQVESRDRKSEVHDGARNRGWRGPLSAHQSRRIILWLLVFLGFAIRFIGSNSKLVSEWTSTLMEVNTPRTDLTELKEASFLFEHGVPVKDQRFLQPPLFILAFGIIPEVVWGALFIIADLVILESLGKLAKKNLIRIFEFESSIPRNSISAETLEGLKDKPAALKVVLEAMNAESEEEAGGIGLSAKHQKEANDLEKFVMLVYALNPFSILSCVGKSLSIFTSLATVLSARFATEGRTTKCFLALAVACYLSPYSYSIIPPIVVVCTRATKKNYWTILRNNLPVLALTLFSLLYLSFLVYGGWGFITRIYTSLLSGEDTSPNLGSLWYLNVEVFPEYQPIFNKAFFVGLMAASLPITFTFSNDPGFALISLCLLYTIVKSEQVASDLALCISLLSLYSRLLYTKTSGHLFFLALLTYPVFIFIYIARYTWMYTDSISPNYLFFSNVYLNILEALVLVFLMRSKKENDWLLYNGVIKTKNIAFILK